MTLRNAFGDHFAYANLASVSAWYPRPKRKPANAQILSTAAPAALASGPRPNGTPASAGAQATGKTPAAARLFIEQHPAPAASRASAVVPLVTLTLNLRSSVVGTTLFTPLSMLNRRGSPALPLPLRMSRTGSCRGFTESSGCGRVSWSWHG